MNSRRFGAEQRLKPNMSTVRRFLLIAIIAGASLYAPLHAAVPTYSRTASVASARQTRSAFLAIINRPRVNLAPQATLMGVSGGIATYHFTYWSEATQRVPGILLANRAFFKDGRRHPVMIVLHGTAGRKESVLDILSAL